MERTAPLHTIAAALRRERERHGISLAELARFTSTLLAACPPGARRDLHMMTAEPGPVREAAAHNPGAVEHMIITSGRWRAGPLDATVQLEPGDYLRFAADQPHCYEALEPDSAAVLIMEYV